MSAKYKQLELGGQTCGRSAAMKAGTPAVSREAGAAADDAPAGVMAAGVDPWLPASDAGAGCSCPGCLSAGRCAV